MPAREQEGEEEEKGDEKKGRERESGRASGKVEVEKSKTVGLKADMERNCWK